MTYPNKSKFIALYRAAQSGHPSAEVGLKSLDEEQKKFFDQFVFDAGALFLELKDELDQGLEDLADACPEQTDPRKWDGQDWQMFRAAVEGHRFEEIYVLMAQGKENIHLVWDELGKRL